MNRGLSLGIRSGSNSLEIAALEGSQPAVTLRFPATQMGIEAIKAFLSGYDAPVRLAVAGVAAVSMALALSSGWNGQVFVVAHSVADHPIALAHYAKRSI